MRVVQSLTAAGQRASPRQGDTFRRLIQPWQGRAFAYYDLLGEIHYAAQFYSRSMSLLRLYAAEISTDTDGTPKLAPTEQPDALAQLERIQDPGGGRTTLLGSYGRLMFLVGESMLFVSIDPDTDTEQWEMLSTDELRLEGNIYMRVKAPSLLAEQYRETEELDATKDFERAGKKATPGNDLEPGYAVAYRLWKRHPRYSALADSTMKGVLELCEELVLLTQAVRARSRLAGSGILFISDEFSPPPAEPTGDEDPEADPFLEDLTNAMMAPIADEGTASAVVPMVVRGPTEAIDKGIKHVQVIDPTQLYPETGLRREAIDRLAIGLDMPPEILTGLADANHWTGWMVDEQTWKGHLQPMAQQLVDDLTVSFFRPTLKALPGWENYCIAYDPTAIINHPDRGKDAQDLYNARAIGKSAYREAKGFDESDAPPENELHEMIGVAVRDSGLAIYGIPTLRSGSELEPTAGEILAPPAGGGVETAPDAGGTGNDAQRGKPRTSGDSTVPETVLGSNGHHVWRVIGACDLALLRARELAGNRIRNRARRDQAVHDETAGVPARQVAALLGRDRVRGLGVASEADLVAGVRPMIYDTLRSWGVDSDVISKLAEMVEQVAARTLYEEHPPPLPPQFIHYANGLAAPIKTDA
jgi:hypothetical protein